MKPALWVGGAIVALVALFLAIGAADPEKSHARRVIELCREGMAANPGNRIAADTCEDLDRNFERKYGRRP